MSNAAIDIKGITKQFDDKIVVDHISLCVKRGSVFGFLGANGSGKTTTIRMICGLLTPTSGAGHCLGFDIKTQSGEIKAQIGYMPQKFSLYTGLTVYENLQFFAAIYQIKEQPFAIKQLLVELELEDYKNTKVANLSGGWKQRLSLACCLLHRPELLFLDEPTAGVDPKARKDFWNYLHKIAVRDGTTVLVTTHYMDEAEKCTDLAYINAGKLLYSGPTQDLVSFSHIKTYVIAADPQLLNKLTGIVESSFPELMVSMVNNELRISSSNHDRLSKFIKEHKHFQFTEVSPSFEEVFIGLMK